MLRPTFVAGNCVFFRRQFGIDDASFALYHQQVSDVAAGVFAITKHTRHMQHRWMGDCTVRDRSRMSWDGQAR